MTTPFPFVAGQVLTAAQLNDIQNLPISDKTASYTLIAGDVTKRTIMNSASATTITVNNSIFTVGDVIQVANKGAGACTITAGAGVTINTSGSLALAQYGGGYLLALSASTFTFFNLGGSPVSFFSLDFLVLAGGGGGGRESFSSGCGGGGGAGGLKSSVTASGGGNTGAELSLAVAKKVDYSVVVGAGGALVSTGSVGNDGSNSSFGISGSFDLVVATGGGGGGGGTTNPVSGRNGGSGGGAANAAVSGTVVGNGTANQGFNGSLGQGSPSGAGGGGGGAGAVAGASSAGNGGAGGAGAANSITGSSVTRGGGGGGCNFVGGSGGAGGSGGGGAGANYGSTNGVSGGANLGGGGGGGANSAPLNSGAGGSGVVILRYADTLTITIGAGLTGTESAASGGYKRATITAGSGNVSWA